MLIYEDRFDLNIFGRVSLTRNRGFNDCRRHFHRQIELQYITSGTVDFTVDGQDYECREGLLMIFPYQLHSNRASPGAKHISAIVSPDSCGVYSRNFLEYRPVAQFIPRDALGDDFGMIFDYCASLYLEDRDNNSLLDAAITCAAGEALRHVELIPVGAGTKQNAVRRVIDHCMANLSGELTLDSVASAVFLDKYYVSKIFSRKLGISFSGFVNDQRICRCCEKLLSTSEPITEIAFSNGFRNQSTFNRVFFERCGCTPGEFRRRGVRIGPPPVR